MNRVRYEAQITHCTEGVCQIRVYDDYWDIVHTYRLNRTDTFSLHDADVELFNGASKLLPDTPGWYAVEVEDYPFGKPLRVFQIPDRHKRYRYQ